MRKRESMHVLISHDPNQISTFARASPSSLEKVIVLDYHTAI